MSAATALAAPPRTIITTVFGSPVGPLLAGATDDGICMLEFAGLRSDEQTEALTRVFDVDVVEGAHPFLDQLRDELAEYFAGRRREFAVPLVIRGTAFQEKVWRELLRIPYGETRSYADVARAVSGSANGSRAVGSANGRNRIAIVIPCHRVVNAGGNLGGYGGGLERKRLLLDLEWRAR
jgi:AraC family transcriptional regulator of adaptative response/methylated-DNA-[protein]-cysteine methyltransferase